MVVLCGASPARGDFRESVSSSRRAVAGEPRRLSPRSKSATCSTCSACSTIRCKICRCSPCCGRRSWVCRPMNWRKSAAPNGADCCGPHSTNWQSAIGNRQSRCTQTHDTFLDQYHRWRELIRHASLTQCIETALNETHYEAFVARRRTRPRGSPTCGGWWTWRGASIRFSARDFIASCTSSLNRKRPRRTWINPPPPPDNAVRLLTIHASKGLEFRSCPRLHGRAVQPARSQRRRFVSTKTPACARKYFPPHTRSKYPSLAHWSAAQRERRALLGEELRLLYVAMTRARDALLLVGTRDQRKMSSSAGRPRRPLTDQALLKAGNYLDWLRLWFANGTQAGLRP